MTRRRYFWVTLRDTMRSPTPRGATRPSLVVGAALAACALVGIAAVPPPPNAYATTLRNAYLASKVQKLAMSTDSTIGAASRDVYSGTPGAESLAANGTNYDWAKLVMSSAGWPMSDANVTVMTRWMRQENGPNDWWNRNNPLNNGWGSGGGAGLGSYPDLVTAAKMAAANLQKNKLFAEVAADFAASAPTEVTEHAIWASPWATSHYANGAHWHYTPVDVFTAPASAWG
jgi:hypothetical protein